MAEFEDQEDELLFADEDAGLGTERAEPLSSRAAWRILIVDDDPDVHTTTTFALRGTQIMHRPLQFLHANSAAEACALIKQDRNIAVILLDVVMEHDDSGLRLVQTLRGEFALTDTRIILRTGQPGYAPEMEAIRDYDINDYKTKSELTRNKLFTTLTSAIRSYDQIRRINASRRGLDFIVRATSELLALSGVNNFAEGVLSALAELLEVPGAGLVCAQNFSDASDAPLGPQVIAASAHYGSSLGMPLSRLSDALVHGALAQCHQAGAHLYTDQGVALYLSNHEGRCMLAWLDLAFEPDEDMKRLVAMFCSNIAIGLDNNLLFSQLHNYAYFDTLSQLPNRRSVIERLDERLGSHERSRYTLVLIDVDDFAETNNALGHSFGDLLLQALAARLQVALGQDSSLGRVAGDTFAILGLTENLLPPRLATIVSEPFLIDGQEVFITVTMGVAHLADIEGRGSDALKDANIALGRAKLNHRGECGFFTRDMAVEIRDRVKLLHALRQAVERGHLFLMYQPQVDIRTGAPCGIEALLRWRGEDGRLIGPDRFIPVAERSGMIVAMGEWVLRLACAQQVALKAEGFANLRVAVNISVSQLRHPRFLDSLRSALADTGADPALIELEITESMAMEEADFLSRTLESVKQLGFMVAVDDFGTGFSSLSYLQRLAVDRLKIDRAFITDIADSDRARRIPELVIQLGQKLGLAVIAEGVETLAQSECLQSMGCQEAQGFYFARPMEPASLLEWLHSHSGAKTESEPGQ